MAKRKNGNPPRITMKERTEHITTTGFDVIGALAANWAASTMAAQTGTLRWNPMGPQDSPWTDVRLLGGGAAFLTSALAGPMMNPWLTRSVNAVAQGALGSFISTEAVRMASVRRATEGPVPGQFGQPTPEQMAALAALEAQAPQIVTPQPVQPPALPGPTLTPEPVKGLSQDRIDMAQRAARNMRGMYR